MNSWWKFKRLWLPATIAVVLSCQLNAQVIVNELSASNIGLIYDEDGDTPDWIELLNTSSNPIQLSDYFISDNVDDPLKNALPAITLSPGEFLLLFASGKDRQGGDVFWDTVVRAGDETKYLLPNASVTENWVLNNFDDTSWQIGTYGLGYGDNDDATVVPNGTISIFTRSKFTIEDLSVVEKLLLNIDYDDAYVAYINGVEISRENISNESPLPFNQFANSYTEPKLVYNQELPTLVLDQFIDALVEGENTFAVQLHNFNQSSSDLTLIPFLSIGFSEQPSNMRGVAAETQLSDIELNNPHLNFKLSSIGETVYLSNSDTVLIDSLTFPPLNADESFGRSLVGDEVFIFTSPTPGAENNAEGFTSRSSNPAISNNGGFFSSDVSISLLNSSLGNITYFTDDGRDPTQSDEVFGTGNRVITETKTLKFRTFEPGGIPSEVVVETYFVNEQHNVPVLSLSTHPDNLWSDESGIYVVGTNGRIGLGYFEEGGANWNQDWEIPVHLELFEDDGNKAFGVGAGAKIYGGWSRLNPAKSLSIFFRGEYGTRSLDYKMFANKNIESFQALVFRNSGNDNSSQGKSMFRDGLMTTLVDGTEIDFQGYRAAVLYINGEYWGIHNIREKINEHFVASNSSSDPDNIDLVQGGGEEFPNGFGAIHGTIENYDELISFVTFSDLRNAEVYAQVEEYIDMDNYIDYMATQIYYGNTDWPGNNIKLWRDRNADGKWRWILYDTDFGFSNYDNTLYQHNTINFALDPSGPGWPNPPWSTILFRELTESEIFRNKFALRMADLMSYYFKPERVHNVIDSLAGLIESEIPRFMSTTTRSGFLGGSVNEWEDQIEIMKNFATRRPIYIENHLTQSINSGGKFGLEELSSLTIYVSDKEHGKVKVNRLLLDTYSWQGQYFKGIDIPLTAIPKAGYEFSQWTGDVSSVERQINVRAGQRVTAHFIPSSSQQDVIINEIMYNADESQESDDWIELYNTGDSSINLAGWALKDEDDSHEFVIPEGTVINANGYLVLAKDQSLFAEIYPEIVNVIGEIGFGFSGNSDQVRLFDPAGTLIDSVLYDDESPWPIEADGTGYSLELIDADSDNAIAENWRASTFQLGSPGLENGLSVSNKEELETPKEIELLQNYPNPFNPSTTISFNLPEATRVQMQVYSITGQLIVNLVDEMRSEGHHSVKWDASSQASGVYFYSLIIGENSLTKKMVLIK